MTSKVFGMGMGAVVLLASGSIWTQESASAASAELEPVLITAQRVDRTSRGAIGLNLEIKETPQSISVVTDEQMTNFGTDNLNDALRLATGINVEEWETNRTNYLARGFEIKNTQVDGVGLPNNWGIVTGAMDSIGYEKLEVIRGANGLLTGVGNSSGTINFVRKRPTNDAQGELGLTAGSWGQMRIEADYSTPLVDSGAWAARVIVAHEDGDSYLRSLQNERSYAYGVIDGQLGERATVTMGYAYQQANTDGNLWGALVLSISELDQNGVPQDGGQAEFPRSSSTTQNWTFWNTNNQNGFLELTYALSDQWALKGTYNYRKSSETDQLFYAYGSLDSVTGLGMYGWPGNYDGSDHAHLGDLSLTGHFMGFGREHEVMLGLSQANSSFVLNYSSVPFTDPAFGALPTFPYAGDIVPEPAWDPRIEYNHGGQRLRRLYGAARLALTDRVKAVVGFNTAEYKRDGVSGFGVPYDQTERETSPYAGLTVDITDHWLAYASYSDIYQPQDQYDINEEYLAPSKGENYEIGLKADWLENRLLTTLAWFSAEQKGLSTFAGINSNGNWYYQGVDVKSSGFEFEAAGRISENVELVFGFTKLDLEGEDGADIYEWVPRETVNLSLSSRLPRFTQITLGLNGRWQSDISTYSYPATIRQDSYATLNVFGEWDVNSKISMRLNVNNVTDEKYINTLYYVGFYGAPQNYTLSFGYRF